MDEPDTHAVNLVRGDRCSDSAAAKRHSTFDLACGDRLSQANDEVGIVVSGI
jgi:hypothetical protein